MNAMIKEIVTRQASVFGSKFWWCDVRDLEQEGWMAALAADAAYQAGRGMRRDVWVNCAVERELMEFIRQTATCLRAPRRKVWDWTGVSQTPISYNGEVKQQRDARVGSAAVKAAPLLSLVPSPEEQLAEAQQNALIEIALREALQREDPRGLVTNHRRVLGDKHSRDIEKETGIEKHKIQQLIRDTKAAVENDPTIRKLWKEAI